MFCFKIMILVFCFTLGANLALGSAKDDTVIANDPENVLGLSSVSGLTQNNILSRIARAVPNPQSTSSDDSDQVDANGDGVDDVNDVASRRVFKPLKDLIKYMNTGSKFLQYFTDKKEGKG